MKKAAGGAEASSEQQGLKRNSKISELRNSPERNQQFLLDLAQPVPHLPLFLGKCTAHAPHQGRAQCVITTQYSPLENGNRNPKLSKKLSLVACSSQETKPLGCLQEWPLNTEQPGTHH